MAWMIISFIIALLVLYKLSSLIGFYDEDDNLFKKPEMKDLNDLEKSEEKAAEEKIQSKNLEIESNLLRSLDQKSQENVRKIHEIDNNINIKTIADQCDFLFTILLKELHNGKIDHLEKYSNEIVLKNITDLIKEKKFKKTLVKIDNIEIQNVDLDKSSNLTVSAKITSEQMEEINDEFKSKVFESHILIGKPLKDEDSNWIILNCDDVLK